VADFKIDLRHAWAAIYPLSPNDALLRQSLDDALAEYDEHDRLTLMAIALFGDPEPSADQPGDEVKGAFDSWLDELIKLMGEREAVRFVGVRILNRLLRLCRQDPPLDWTFETLHETQRGDSGLIHGRVIMESSKRIFANRQHSRRELYKRFVSDSEWLVAGGQPLCDSIEVAYYGDEPLRLH
jgi:hypothetical protein